MRLHDVFKGVDVGIEKKKSLDDRYTSLFHCAGEKRFRATSLDKTP